MDLGPILFPHLCHSEPCRVPGHTGAGDAEALATRLKDRGGCWGPVRPRLGATPHLHPCRDTSPQGVPLAWLLLERTSCPGTEAGGHRIPGAHVLTGATLATLPSYIPGNWKTERRRCLTLPINPLVSNGRGHGFHAPEAVVTQDTDSLDCLSCEDRLWLTVLGQGSGLGFSRLPKGSRSR